LKEAGLQGRGKENLLWLDDALGALFNKLEQHHLVENTIIFFFNDHGQKSKGTIYQGGVHNPSIIWKKDGFQCGSRSNAQISNVDFAPTILDMVGIDYSGQTFDGISFKPVLDGKTDKTRDSLYFELGYARGVLKDQWKYMAIRYPEQIENMSREERQRVLDEYNAGRIKRDLELVTKDPAKPFSHLTAVPGGGHAESRSTGKYPGYYDRDQLYDLSKDPGERKNLAKDVKYQDQLKMMKAELRKYLDDLPGNFPL
jgi:arylsulfatase A-like enzyme